MPFLLHQLLAESAERGPCQLAVVSPERSLTYGELDALSNQIAHQLRADGVRPGDRVGVFMPKSADAVAALFGIMKAGAAYVPIDPNSPAARASYILQNCAVRGLIATPGKLASLPAEFFASGSTSSILISQNQISENQISENRVSEKMKPVAGVPVTSFAELAMKQPKTNPRVAITDSNLAYILYTSGSTGKPKGVMISHLNSLTFVNWAYDEFHVEKSDRVSSHAPFHFDLSVFDLYCAVKAGATIYLVPKEVQAFPQQLAAWIAQQEITIWYSVPSALIQLAERGNLEAHNYEKLHTVLFAGEVFPLKYLRQVMQHLPKAGFYNLYGPTETNVCTFYKVKAEDIAAGRTEPVPIGAACANTEVFAVDAEMRRVGVGGEGELLVRSETIMKGYWGRPDATAETVIQNPLHADYAQTVYRTGDIVELLPSGDYKYIGRRDKMIKSRGYRIELGEIEAALYSHPEIKEAAVVAVPDEKVGARIAAYVVSKNGTTRQELEKYCLDRLPRYMVPEQLELRADLPKTSTGKIDRTSLEEETKKSWLVAQ
jgi:amino acid adenylation domain-containing protein